MLFKWNAERPFPSPLDLALIFQVQWLSLHCGPSCTWPQQEPPQMVLFPSFLPVARSVNVFCFNIPPL